MNSLETFIRLTDNLIDFEAEFNAISCALHSTFSLEVHREEIRSIWSIIKSGYEACLREIEVKYTDGDLDVDLTSVKRRYQSSYQTYVRCVAKIGEFTQLIADTSAVSTPRINEVPPPSSNFHLPPCDTQIFHGDYLSWPSFRDMFTAIYINNTRLSPVEKLFHLNQKTRGEAQDIVKKSPLTNDGFFLAWKNLKDRFENKRILINSLLRILFNLSSISIESSTAIKKLQRDINSCVSALQLHDINIENWDPIFVYLCSSRLPDATLALWEQSINNKTEIPLWSHLDSFLTSRYQTLETVYDIKCSASQKPPFQKIPSSHEARSQQKKVNTYVTTFSSSSCQLCPKEQHTIRQCPRFLNVNQEARISCIKKLGLCLNCFAGPHNIRDCKSQHNCFKCNKRHNTLLHRDASYNVSSLNTNSPSTSKDAARRSGTNITSNSAGPCSHATQIQSTETIPVKNIQSCFASNFKSVLLGTAIVHVCHLGITYSARALIDSGSEGTFISERLFRLLKLPFNKTSAQISGLNNATSAQVQKICSFTLASPIDSKISIEATALVVPRLTGNLPSRPFDPSFLANIPNIQLADIEFFKSSHIDLLIGGDLFPSAMQDGIQRNIGGSSLLAQQTIFGWILTGPVPKDPVASLTTCVSFFTEISLDKEISRFWEVEDLPHKHHMSPSDRFCEEHFANTTKRNADGRYVVKLPFKESFPDSTNLGHSRAMAHAQFMRNEFRLAKDPNFKIEYDNVVREYLDLNHMQLVPIPKFQHFPRHYYLPHHAVIKPESTSTKVRVVFNASSTTSNGKVLTMFCILAQLFNRT